jgi:hypothetical protein
MEVKENFNPRTLKKLRYEQFGTVDPKVADLENQLGPASLTNPMPNDKKH